MKKILFSTFGISSALLADAHHGLEGEVFYIKHQEPKYKYEFFGSGVNYHLHQEKGMNLEIGCGSNFSERDFFFQSTSRLKYRIPLEEWVIYPSLSSQINLHRNTTEEEGEYLLYQSWIHVGIGFCTNVYEYLNAVVEGNFSFQTNDSITLLNTDVFKGRIYPNKNGYSIKAGIIGKIANHLSYKIIGNLLKDWEEISYSRGINIALEWVF